MSADEVEKLTEQQDKVEEHNQDADGKQDTNPATKKKGGKGSKGTTTKRPSGPTAGGGFRLNVKNFSKETAESPEKLKALFEPFGNITDAQIKTRDDGKFLGLGFIVFTSEEEAQKAIVELNEKEFDGRKISVSPAERRIEDAQWAGYQPQATGFGKGKGKGKDKGTAMTQQFAAMQAAYAAAYTQMWSANMGAGGAAEEKQAGAQSGTDVTEQMAPGDYTGTLKNRTRYGQKKSYLISPTTFQYYGSDIHIEKELIPDGAKDGDTVTFTVAAAYGEAKWEDKTGWTTPYARGYPKAKTARLISAASKAEEKA